MTTIAGLAGNWGTVDGIGSAARFLHPAAVAVAPSGNLYVADSANTIRRLTLMAGGSDWQVTTLAGRPLTFGSTDGTGGEARFGGAPAVGSTPQSTTVRFPSVSSSANANPVSTGVSYSFADVVGLAVDPAENVFVSDFSNNTIRMISPAGNVTTIGGTAGVGSQVDGIGTAARFSGPAGIAIDRSGNLYIADCIAHTIRKAVSINAGRIVNLSIRTDLANGETLIVGFVASGGTKPLLLRAVGPTLRDFGVGGAMPDPQLSLYTTGAVVATNDNWGAGPGAAQLSSAAAQVGAFPLPASSLDAAMLAIAAGDGTTAQAYGRNGGGIVLVELYDTAPTTAPRLVNVSARSRVGVGESALFAGFVIGGSTSRTLLVRAIGPTLGAFGVTGMLADPRLDIFAAGAAAPLAGNDNWNGDSALVATFAVVGAFPLPAGTSRDAVLRITLEPGAYTARISGVGNTTGEALLEIYEVP